MNESAGQCDFSELLLAKAAQNYSPKLLRPTNLVHFVVASRFMFSTLLYTRFPADLMGLENNGCGVQEQILVLYCGVVCSSRISQRLNVKKKRCHRQNSHRTTFADLDKFKCFMHILASCTKLGWVQKRLFVFSRRTRKGRQTNPVKRQFSGHHMADELVYKSKSSFPGSTPPEFLPHDIQHNEFSVVQISCPAVSCPSPHQTEEFCVSAAQVSAQPRVKHKTRVVLPLSSFFFCCLLFAGC